MSTYKIEIENVTVAGTPVKLFRVGFIGSAENTTIVRDAESRMVELKAQGGCEGRLALVNGPASLAVAMVLAHHILHLFGGVGVFDPKLGGYVVAAAHGGDYRLGDLIPAADVVAAVVAETTTAQ